TCENNEYGMALQGAENNLIFSNEFRNNDDYGVYLYSS
ncbi:MAG: NosD domain-containing protein, partial [Candidatus Heimdallarchaeota archaeon]